MPLIAWKFNRFGEIIFLYLVALGHWQFLLLPLLTVYAKCWAVTWLQPVSLSWVLVKLSALTPQQTVSPGKEELQGEVRVFRPIRCWKIVLWNYYFFDTNLNNLRPSPSAGGKNQVLYWAPLASKLLTRQPWERTGNMPSPECPIFWIKEWVIDAAARRGVFELAIRS